MKIRIYQYEKCSTCRKALKFLDARKVVYEKRPIVEAPPSKAELHRMFSYVGGDLRKLFNTSGLLYRGMKVGEKVKNMNEDQAVDLLSRHGKLIRRPFLLADNFGFVGFDEARWKMAFSQPRPKDPHAL